MLLTQRLGLMHGYIQRNYRLGTRLRIVMAFCMWVAWIERYTRLMRRAEPTYGSQALRPKAGFTQIQSLLMTVFLPVIATAPFTQWMLKQVTRFGSFKRVIKFFSPLLLKTMFFISLQMTATLML